MECMNSFSDLARQRLTTLSDAQNDIVDNDDSRGLLLPRYKTPPAPWSTLSLSRLHLFAYEHACAYILVVSERTAR
jgi:hypothetical protein